MEINRETDFAYTSPTGTIISTQNDLHKSDRTLTPQNIDEAIKFHHDQHEAEHGFAEAIREKAVAKQKVKMEKRAALATKLGVTLEELNEAFG